MKNLFNFDMVSPKIDATADKKNQHHKTFIIEPLESGYGTTIGNAIRRVALASMPGGAITQIEIKGIQHEFSTIENIEEDMTTIVLAIKNIVLRMDTVGEVKLKISKDKKGPVTAGDIVCPDGVEVINPKLVLANINKDKTKFEMTLIANRGVGYKIAEENRGNIKTSGKIFIDSIFTPIEKLTYQVEDTRVGKTTNYDRLIIDIWTNGSLTPEEALSLSGHLLIEQVANLRELEKNLKNTIVFAETQAPALNDDSIETLELKKRSHDALLKADIDTIPKLVTKTKKELLDLENIGNTSILEIETRLEAQGLKLQD